MLHKTLAILAVMMLVPAVVAQQGPQEQEQVPDASEGLVPGDTLQIRFWDFPELGTQEQPVTVGTKGTIYVPYVGPIKVAGMMPEDAESAIIDALKTKQVVTSPQVSLSVVSARNLSVLVLGQVAQPHPVPLFAPAPLSLLLSQVGGFTTTASYHVLIAHKDGTAPTDVELDRTMSNLEGMKAIVRPGDIVSVAQAGSFYALGEFNHPGIFPLVGSQEITLLKAISIAGGPTLYAGLSKARVLRMQKDGTRMELLIDIAKLQRGEAPDPLIRPDDILYVPRNNGKVFMYSWLTNSIQIFYAVSLARTF